MRKTTLALFIYITTGIAVGAAADVESLEGVSENLRKANLAYFEYAEKYKKGASAKAYKQADAGYTSNTINNFIVQRNLDIKVIQLHPSAENGFPHTRPNNIVCIPSNLKFPSLEKTTLHSYPQQIIDFT